MRVAELEGARLDYWVARALVKDSDFDGKRHWIKGWLSGRSPSTEWKDGGPIIEQERITVQPMDYMGRADWQASEDRFLRTVYDGPTPLIAAMRAFVASRYGDEVPDSEEQA